MSYMRLVQFKFSPANVGGADLMASDLIPSIKQQPGCISAAFFGGGADGECGICVHWETLGHADAAAAVIGPRLQQHLTGKVVSPADIRLMPVLVS